MVVIEDSLSELASSADGEDGEDEYDQEAVQGQLSEEDEPSWMMRTITKTVRHRLERVRQKQMKLHEVTPPAWEDAPYFFTESDEKYGTSALTVLAFV